MIPTRVVIDRAGTAVRPSVALAMGIFPSEIFIRNDGWSLGAPGYLLEVARREWRDAWIEQWRFDVARNRYRRISPDPPIWEDDAQAATTKRAIVIE